MNDEIEKKKLNKKEYWVVTGWSWKEKYSIEKGPKIWTESTRVYLPNLWHKLGDWDNLIESK
jgi:hypothetical protein